MPVLFNSEALKAEITPSYFEQNISTWPQQK